MTTTEIRSLGIRPALGATPASILRLVVRRGMAMAGVGVAIGLVMSLFLMCFLQSLLFGIRSIHPLIFVGDATILAVASFVAVYLPGRNAANINPVTALRDN